MTATAPMTDAEERDAYREAYFDLRQWVRDRYGTDSLAMPDYMRDRHWFPGVFTE